MASHKHNTMATLRACERDAVIAKDQAQQDLRDLLAEYNVPMHKVIVAYRIMQRFADVAIFAQDIEDQLSVHPENQ